MPAPDLKALVTQAYVPKAPREVPAQGPRNARVMVVGEAPGENEEREGVPFVGNSGLELSRMLREAGFNRSDCYVTNVCGIRPPGNEIGRFFGKKTDHLPAFLGRYPRQPIVDGVRRLEREIAEVNPDLILAFGDTALWATTGESGITKWRGSELEYRKHELQPGLPHRESPKVVPTYHPAAILRQWSWRYVAVQDLRRAKRSLDASGRLIHRPILHLTIRPTFEAVQRTLSDLQKRLDDSPLWLSVDIETQRWRWIDCIGIAWSATEALTIPFLQMDKGADQRLYWPLDEEVAIVMALLKVLTHPNAKVVGQNFIYDQQYIAKLWGFLVNLLWDTMTVHHSIFCMLPKALDFQSSLYCDYHRYWKEDAKDETGSRLDDLSHWTYNAEDCIRTYEIREKQELLLTQMNFRRVAGETPQERQMSFHRPVLEAMLRGVRFDEAKAKVLHTEVRQAITDRERWIETALGHKLNPRSHPQMKNFFLHDMGMRPIRNRKSKKADSATFDEGAMEQYARREPLLAPICLFINDIRSLGTFKNVIDCDRDTDRRLRCSYTIPGTDTYRFSSSTDAFGFGTNLQNITSGTSGKAEEIAALVAKGVLVKPNLRKLITPDPGMTICEFDLPQADARIVAWEANDPILKAIFKDPSRDLHTENARAIFGACTGKEDPRRQYAKVGVHAVNYGATARVLAAALGITERQAQEFIDKWFIAHPAIATYDKRGVLVGGWHFRLLHEATTRKYVENVFGYRRYCFDRIDSEKKEIFAWGPQSTVAVVTNTGIRQTVRELSMEGVEFLLQVHDSAVFQFPTSKPQLARAIQQRMMVECPFEGDPLVMVPDAKFSEVSWGDCAKRQEWLQAA